ELRSSLSAIRLPLGEAFQLRDDLLGVFGDPELTGKPAGDDLREGRRTVLVARAFENADATQARLLASEVGRPDLTGSGVDVLRTVIADTGARAAVEDQIATLEHRAADALDAADIPADARDGIAALARRATRRQS